MADRTAKNLYNAPCFRAGTTPTWYLVIMLALPAISTDVTAQQILEQLEQAVGNASALVPWHRRQYSVYWSVKLG